MTTSPLPGIKPRQDGLMATAPMSGLSSNNKLPQFDTPELAQAAALLEMQQNEERRKKQEWVSWAESQFVKCRNSRTQFERQWYLNLAFYSGKHYISPVEVPGQGFRLTTPKAPPWRVRLVINKVRMAVRKECSKLTSSKPIPTVVPATNEDEDQTAAIVSEAVLKAKFANAQFEEQYRQWVWWGVVCGTSYMKSYWDPTEKDYDAMSIPEPPKMPNGEPMPDILLEKIKSINPKLEEFLKTPQPAVGKITVERISPFHVFVPDLLCEDIQGQPYIIHVMTRTPEWVKNKFGFTPTCDSRAAQTIMDAATIIARGHEDTMDAVLVKEMWIKPYTHPDFPQGGMLTIINSRAVQVHKTWPVPFQDYPFYKYNGIPTGGFYTESPVTDLIPLQKEYNRTRSQMIEIKNVMGKPKIIYPKGSVNPRKISTEPGQSVEYVAGFAPPTVMPGTDVPSTFWNEAQQLADEFNDISGQHDITNGSTPSGVSSGTAIAYLQEQDDSQLSYQVAGIERACESLGNHYLDYVTQYWQDDRIIKVTGRNNTYESIHWKRSAIQGNTDVRVQTGSALPTSKAAKQALITEMMTNGFLSPEVGLEILDMGTFEKAMDEFLIDKKQATRENLKIQDAPDKVLALLMQPPPGPNGESGFEQPGPNGQNIMINYDGTPFQPQPFPPVNSWDNHEAHIQWHNQYRKTQEFEQLSQPKKQALELHVQAHQMAMMLPQVNSMGSMLQPGMDGTTGLEPGPPVGPESEPQEPGAATPPGGPSGGQQTMPPAAQQRGASMGRDRLSQDTSDMKNNYDRRRYSGND